MQQNQDFEVTSPFIWPMDSRYVKPFPLTWTSEYAYSAAMFELLNILAVEKDYGVKLQSLDFENFTFLGATFSGAAELQELLYAVILEHTAIPVTATTDHHRFGLRIRSFARAKAIIAVRKSIPDVEIDQFSPRQTRLYIFYGQGQSRPAHHIINFYIRQCKRNDLPVGDLAEFQIFMMHFYGAPTSAAFPLTSSDSRDKILPPDNPLVGGARRRGVDQSEYEEFSNQFRQHKIELALEHHNRSYLQNQRRSSVETRVSNFYYDYSQSVTPEDTPSKRKKVKLCRRLSGTSVKKTKVPARPLLEPEPSPPSRRSSRNRRKETQHNPVKVISGGKAVSSRTQSPVNDDTAQEEVPELRSAPRTTTSIPVAIPIAQDVDPVATPVSRRRSSRLNESTDSSSVVQSLTRSESARVWRKFAQSVMRSEQDLTWREHARNFNAAEAESGVKIMTGKTRPKVKKKAKK
jgi:hypothetical protein